MTKFLNGYFLISSGLHILKTVLSITKNSCKTTTIARKHNNKVNRNVHEGQIRPVGGASVAGIADL